MTTKTLPPGPPGKGLGGNLTEFRRDKLAFLSRCAQEHGDVSTFRLGNKQIFLVLHPNDIEKVLVSHNRNFEKHYITQLLRPTLGNGLLISEGTFWLRQRRLMQPAFQKQRIDSYAPLIVEHTQRLTDKWQHGQSFDLHSEMMRLALNIVAQALLDVDVSTPFQEVEQALDVLMSDFSYRFESLLPWPLWVPTPRNLRMRSARQTLRRIIDGIIQTRRHSQREHVDLLSLLLSARDEQNGQGMNDLQLRDEVMTIFLAGHEFSINALSWTWLLLMQHPQVEMQLQAELQRVLQGQAPTLADVPHLKFTTAVVQEAMRLYPPVFTFGRKIVQACELGGYLLPVGGTVLLSQWVVHRDARWFADPQEFHPQRWLQPEIDSLPKYAYFPFGGGPRVCIGNTFAMLEATLALAYMADHFHFELQSDKPVVAWPSITLRPRHGIPVRVMKRTGEKAAIKTSAAETSPPIHSDMN